MAAGDHVRHLHDDAALPTDGNEVGLVTEPMYGPTWFSMQIKPVQDEVMSWLAEHGVAPEHCAGFDYDPTTKQVVAHVYDLDAFGHGQYDDEGNPKMADPERFKARWVPAVVAR